MLEVVDNAFDDIAESIDKYQGEVQREDTATLSQETINTISLKEFLRGSSINMESIIVAIPYKMNRQSQNSPSIIYAA